MVQGHYPQAVGDLDTSDCRDRDDEHLDLISEKVRGPHTHTETVIVAVDASSGVPQRSGVPIPPFMFGSGMGRQSTGVQRSVLAGERALTRSCALSSAEEISRSSRYIENSIRVIDTIRVIESSAIEQRLLRDSATPIFCTRYGCQARV